MNLPCIKSKCLKYPACKNKKFIICTPLREYCDEITRTMQVQDGQMATPSENAKKGEIKRLFTSTLKGNKQSRIMLNKFISKVA